MTWVTEFNNGQEARIDVKKKKGIVNIEEKRIDLIKFLSYALERNVKLKPVILVRYFRSDTNEVFVSSLIPDCFICMTAHGSSSVWFCSCSHCNYLGLGHEGEEFKPVSLIS